MNTIETPFFHCSTFKNNPVIRFMQNTFRAGIYRVHNNEEVSDEALADMREINDEEVLPNGIRRKNKNNGDGYPFLNDLEFLKQINKDYPARRIAKKRESKVK